MAEILFYHLTQSTLDAALPPLVEMTVERGWRAVIRFGTPERRDLFNDLLWTWKEESFIPHCTDDSPDADETAVVLTLGTGNPNRANVEFNVDGAPAETAGSTDRTVLMFDGMVNEEVEAARGHWRRLKSGDHALTYWQQMDSGRWEKKA